MHRPEAMAGSANVASVGSGEAARQLDVILDGWARQISAPSCAGAAGAPTPLPEQRDQLRDCSPTPAANARIRVVHDSPTAAGRGRAGRRDRVDLRHRLGGLGTARDGRSRAGRRLGLPARRRGQRVRRGPRSGAPARARAARPGRRAGPLAWPWSPTAACQAASTCWSASTPTRSADTGPRQAGVVFELADAGDPAAARDRRRAAAAALTEPGPHRGRPARPHPARWSAPAGCHPPTRPADPVCAPAGRADGLTDVRLLDRRPGARRGRSPSGP